MRTLPACVVGAALTLVACGGDDPAAPDAGDVQRDAPPLDAPVVYDLACATTPLPTTGPADLTVAGATVAYANRATGIGAVGLEIFKVLPGSNESVATLTTGADGAFASGSLPNQSLPFRGFFLTTRAGSRHTLLYPALPLTASLVNLGVPVLTAAEFAALDTAGVQDDSSNGALLISVEDCAGTPVATATLTATQGGANVGAISALPGRAGTFLVLNVPAGRTLIGGRVPGPSGAVELYAHEVLSRAANGVTPGGALTITSLRPGP